MRHTERFHRGITSNIHDDIAQLKETLGLKSLGEEIGHVVNSVDIVDHDLTILQELTNIEMSTLDMLCAVVMLRVVRQVNGASVVDVESGSGAGGRIGHRVSEAQFGKEPGSIHGLLGGFRSGNDLRFAREEGDGLLFFRTPRDGGLR